MTTEWNDLIALATEVRRLTSLIKNEQRKRKTVAREKHIAKLRAQLRGARRALKVARTDAQPRLF